MKFVLLIIASLFFTVNDSFCFEDDSDVRLRVSPYVNQIAGSVGEHVALTCSLRNLPENASYRLNWYRIIGNEHVIVNSTTNEKVLYLKLQIKEDFNGTSLYCSLSILKKPWEVRTSQFILVIISKTDAVTSDYSSSSSILITIAAAAVGVTLMIIFIMLTIYVMRRRKKNVSSVPNYEEQMHVYEEIQLPTLRKSDNYYY